MSKKRSFEYLKNSMTQEEFIKFCTKVATQYATSESNFARTYFTENFNITQSCYHKILDYSVINNLVSDKLVNSMEKKAIANQNLHAHGAGITSVNHYKELRVQRREKILKKFNDKDIIEITTLYALEEMSKDDLAILYNVSTRIIDLIIKKGIVENKISDELFYRIEQRVLLKDNSYSTKKFFEDLHKERNSNKATLE